MATATLVAVVEEAVSPAVVCNAPVKCTKIHSATSAAAMVSVLCAASRSRFRPGSELTRASTHRFRMRSGAPAGGALVNRGGSTLVVTNPS